MHPRLAVLRVGSIGTALAALTLTAGLGMQSAPARAELAPSIAVLPVGIVAPWSEVIEGADGHFYGTTVNGGVFGTVFKMTPSGSVSPVYRFPTRSDGAEPDAPVIQGMDGRLFGVTNYEGGPKRCATVFAVNTDGTGYKVLHTFEDTDGCRPYGGLVQGDDGTLYGTVTEGGTIHLGGIFKLSPDGSNFAVVRLFQTEDGSGPIGGLIQGVDGRIYGTTYMRGPRGGGTIFAFQPDGSGFTTIFGFGKGSTDGGANPRTGVTQGPDGTLYGATSTGGRNTRGTVYRIKPDGTGFTALHEFGAAGDGNLPEGDILLASDGRLYGTTAGDGSKVPGTIFSIKTDGTDYQTIHTFRGGTSEGLIPKAGMIQASDGSLVGTTLGGQGTSSGTVFRLALGLPRPVPTIRSFTPKSGPWGTQVLIHGRYFVNASAAGFHGVNGQVNVSSAQWARITVPTMATTGPVSITTPGGTGTGATFTVLPTVTALSRTTGKFGDQVTITGTNFTGVKSVTFGGTASSYTVNSPTQITATVPEDSASGPLVVTTADGPATAPAGFTVTSARASISISSLTLTHAVKGTQAPTQVLKPKETGTFTATYTAQNLGTRAVVATITFLKGGKSTGKPVTMRAATANGATILTAAKSFSGSKKATSLQAQVSATIGSVHDQKSLNFKVSAKGKK